MKGLVVASVACAFTLIAARANAGFISNGLVAYWKLNDHTGATAADNGKGFPMTLLGSPSWGGNFLTLNGSTQYGDAGTNAAEVAWGDMTVCAWIKKNSYSFKSIIDKSFDIQGVGVGGWGLWVEADGHLAFFAGKPLIDNGPQTVVPGQWTFVAAVWHKAGQHVEFYYNGLVTSSVQDSAAMNYFTYQLARVRLGNLQNNSGNGTHVFDGSLHDVAIYNRALSASEIQSNFVATDFSTNVAAPDLLYYKMTENNQLNSPVFLADSSTHGGTTGTILLTAPNTMQWVTNQGNVPASAAHFNGVQTYLDTSNSVLFNFTTNSFTINVWLMPMTANGCVMANGSYQNSGWFMGIGGSYELVFGSENPSQETAVSTTTPVSGWPSVYNMVTITRSGTNTPQIYINGTFAAQTGSFANPASSSGSLVMGKSKPGGHFLDGNMWAPQIWSTSLTAADVANLYYHQLSGVPWP